MTDKKMELNASKLYLFLATQTTQLIPFTVTSVMQLIDILQIVVRRGSPVHSQLSKANYYDICSFFQNTHSPAVFPIYHLEQIFYTFIFLWLSYIFFQFDFKRMVVFSSLILLLNNIPKEGIRMNQPIHCDSKKE